MSVISLRFENGSQVDVAKVEGSVGYKQTMRAQAWYLPTDSVDIGSIALTMVASDTFWPNDICTRGVRDHLPCWLGGRCPDSMAHLAAMLRALKVSAISYLGQNFADTIVVLPAQPPESMRCALDHASDSESLSLQMRLKSPAGQMAAYANGLSDARCLYGERKILTVEYSRAALTTMLFEENCGPFEAIRGSHNESLGAILWSNVTREAMLSELRDVARNEHASNRISDFDALCSEKTEATGG